MKKINTLKKQLQELNNSSKEYLDEYINNECYYKTLEDFEDCVYSTKDVYTARVWDLAVYATTNELLYKLK